MKLFQVRPLRDSDRPWVTATLRSEWGDAIIVSRGRVHQADTLPGFIAIKDGEPVGLITYRIEGDGCEVISLNSMIERIGVGSALIETLRSSIKGRCARVWLITTNDNMYALRFYQKRGFRLVQVHRNAADQARTLKPGIPLFGHDDIPVHDEIELESAPS